MKVHKPGTDQIAEFQILINDEAPATEFDLLETHADAKHTYPYIAECFVEVKPMDVISVRGTFSGTVHEVVIDLVADGSLLATRHAEATTGHVAQDINRSFFIKPVLSNVIPTDWIGEEPPTKFCEGKLCVQALSAAQQANSAKLEYESDTTDKPGLGSIAVVVNVSNHAAEADREDPEFDITCGRWSSRVGSIVRKSGLGPCHELVLESNGDAVSQKRSMKARRNAMGHRPGTMPWTKLIFYYRSKEGINRAGCTLRPAGFSFALGHDSDQVRALRRRESQFQERIAKKLQPSPLFVGSDEEYEEYESASDAEPAANHPTKLTANEAQSNSGLSWAPPLRNNTPHHRQSSLSPFTTSFDNISEDSSGASSPVTLSKIADAVRDSESTVSTLAEEVMPENSTAKDLAPLIPTTDKLLSKFTPLHVQMQARNYPNAAAFASAGKSGSLSASKRSNTNLESMQKVQGQIPSSKPLRSTQTPSRFSTVQRNAMLSSIERYDSTRLIMSEAEVEQIQKRSAPATASIEKNDEPPKKKPRTAELEDRKQAALNNLAEKRRLREAKEKAIQARAMRKQLIGREIEELNQQAWEEDELSTRLQGSSEDGDSAD